MIALRERPADFFTPEGFIKLSRAGDGWVIVLPSGDCFVNRVWSDYAAASQVARALQNQLCSASERD